MKRSLLDHLATTYQFPVPQGMVDLEFDAIWKQLTDEMERTKETFSAEGQSEEEARAEYRAIAERRVRCWALSTLRSGHWAIRLPLVIIQSDLTCYSGNHCEPRHLQADFAPFVSKASLREQAADAAALAQAAFAGHVPEAPAGKDAAAGEVPNTSADADVALALQMQEVGCSGCRRCWQHLERVISGSYAAAQQSLLSVHSCIVTKGISSLKALVMCLGAVAVGG